MCMCVCLCTQHMETEDEAKAAIDALDGYSVNGSHIHVEVSL